MIKTLAKQIKEFKRDSLLTPVFMVLEVLMETVIPLLMASIIDDGVEKGDIHHIYMVGGAMVVLAAIAWPPACWAVPSAHGRRQDSPAICVSPCMTTSRPSPLPASTNFPPPA